MDIPYQSMAVLTVWASSRCSGDTHNLLHLRSNLHPFFMSDHGTITLNFSHIPDNYEDRAAWGNKLGYTAMADNSHREIPCKVYVNFTAVGEHGYYYDH
jgi:hypothetical protein